MVDRLMVFAFLLPVSTQAGRNFSIHLMDTKIMINKKLVYSLAVIFMIPISNITHATTITSSSVDWSTFNITANGTDVSSTINWGPQQYDYIETEYREGSDGPFVYNDHSIDPNNDWAINQETSDGSTSRAETSVSNSALSATTRVDYTGKAESFIIRHGEFIADAATYTFSLDYTTSTEINSTNTDLSGSNSNAYIELLIINQTVLDDPDRFELNEHGSNAHVYLLVENDTVNVFESVTSSGSLMASEYFSTDLFEFLDGDLITIGVTLKSSSFNTSSTSAPVPLPPAFMLLATSYGLLFSFKKLKKQG